MAPCPGPVSCGSNGCGRQQPGTQESGAHQAAQPPALVQVDMRSGGFKGYRAVVTKPSGQRFWVDMPVAGADTFLHDQLAGGSVGGLYREKRVPEDPQSLDQYGYNQVGAQGGLWGLVGLCAGLVRLAGCSQRVQGVPA